jgi:hypothetical protein
MKHLKQLKTKPKSNIMNKKTILYRTLVRALSLKRPDGGKGVDTFVDWLWDEIPKSLHTTSFFDDYNNLHVDAREVDTNRTLFVAHVDTVHRDDGANKIRKTKSVWYADGSQLGADDGAGCAVLMHLMASGVAGYYVFTQGEECGGKGAKYLVEHHADLLAQFDRAIAFDRRGVSNVISHQGWGRCCSDAFADGLCDAFNVSQDLLYMPDDGGVYTDTAEFVDIIPECTNISVGYEHEHSDKENINVEHFAHLAARVVDIDWDALPTERDPSVPDPVDDYKWDSKWDSKWSKMGATSVSSQYTGMYEDAVAGGYIDDSLGLDYDLDLDQESEYLRDLLLDAYYDGHVKNLIEFVAEMVYPEDSQAAVRLIDRKQITQERLEEALKMLAGSGAEHTSCWLYDQTAVMA